MLKSGGWDSTDLNTKHINKKRYGKKRLLLLMCQQYTPSKSSLIWLHKQPVSWQKQWLCYQNPFVHRPLKRLSPSVCFSSSLCRCSFTRPSVLFSILTTSPHPLLSFLSSQLGDSPFFFIAAMIRVCFSPRHKSHFFPIHFLSKLCSFFLKILCFLAFIPWTRHPSSFFFFSSSYPSVSVRQRRKSL